MAALKITDIFSYDISKTDNGSSLILPVNGVNRAFTYVSNDTGLSLSSLETNAQCIAAVFTYCMIKPWSLNAIAAILGNLQAESTINPARNEKGGGSGYGLVLWTPKEKYTTYWCNYYGLDASKMSSALIRIAYEMVDYTLAPRSDGKSISLWASSTKLGTWGSTTDFIYNNTDSVEELAKKWMLAYERPTNTNPAQRLANAKKWLEFLSSNGFNGSTYLGGAALESPSFSIVKIFNKTWV